MPDFCPEPWKNLKSHTGQKDKGNKMVIEWFIQKIIHLPPSLGVFIHSDELKGLPQSKL